MKNSFLKSFSPRLALRFMFIMMITVLFLSFFFLWFTQSLVRSSQTAELKSGEQIVFESVQKLADKNELKKHSGGIINSISAIPYFLTYIVYDADTEILISTNDPFLPLLSDTQGRAKHFFSKGYFFDGDLDIFYYAKAHPLKERNIVVAVAMNLDNNIFTAVFKKLPLALLFMALPMLALSFFLSFFITKNTIKPVVRITKAAQSVTTENLSDLLPLSGYNDEIDELSKAFNELFLRIKLDFDRERQFSSDVSHELNTPLQVISGQANLLLRWGKNDPSQLEKSLVAIKMEAKTMQAVIANLLQISRIESGRVKPQISEVVVGGLFSWMSEEFASVAPNAKILAEDNGAVFNTDPEMLHQILTVLISNSIKYAGESCTINLKAKKGKDIVIIELSDDGPGFSEESLPHIFERFYRADEAHSRKIAGSGLGLAIAQTLCTALGAKIKARNILPHGAGFTIEFTV